MERATVLCAYCTATGSTAFIEVEMMTSNFSLKAPRTSSVAVRTLGDKACSGVRDLVRSQAANQVAVFP
jgi:hypothetical protein